MALRSEYSLGHSEFNDFLFAFVGEENNGTQLTVLSALARLDLDPWVEATRLSKLTKKAAISALATKIAGLPEGDWKASDSQSIAVRLVDLLPRHVSAPDKSSLDKFMGDKKPMSETQKWLLWIGLAFALFMVVTRLFGH